MKNLLQLTVLTALLILAFTDRARSQQILTKPMPFLEQLSSNEVTNLYQDREGFIWLGTSNGLERYDGYDIQVFRNNYHRPALLSDNHITCFTEDSSHLWVGTHKGVNRVDKKTYQIHPFADSTIQASRIRDLLTDRNGTIWIAADHTLCKYHPEQGILNRYSFFYPSSSHGSNISSLYEDRSGNIWVLTWRNGLFRYSKEEDSFVQYPPAGEHNNPYCLFQDKDGRYWIATWEDGLWAFSPDSGKESMYRPQKIRNSTRDSWESIFFSLAQDDVYGYIWAVSYSELFALQLNEKGDLEKVNIDALVEKNKMYSKILKDRDGNLWLGAFDKGDILIFEKSKINNYRITGMKKHIGFEPNIIRLNKDKGGIIWFDQERYGICLFNEKTGEVTYGYDGNPTSSVETSVILPAARAGEMWIGTKYTSELVRMKREGMKASVVETINLGEVAASPGYIRYAEEDRQGNLWIGTDEHLFFKPEGESRVWLVTIDIKDITCMTRDQKGDIWVGSRSGGIYHMTGNHRPLLRKQYANELAFLNGDKIESMCTDRDNRIWFSTTQGRLISLDQKNQEFRDRTEECNLKGDAILRILADQENIWIVCNKSIIQHNYARNKNFLYSTTDETITVSSFRSGAAFIGQDKQLYAAGHGGFTVIRPMSATQAPNPSREVFITDVRSNNTSMLFSPAFYAENNSIRQITLAPENRNVEIIFSSLTYVSNRKIKYAYKMEGTDENWTYLDGGKHTAFYNRLDKGTYTFRVKSTDEYGNWSEKETLLAITMLPAWYETWYAYLLYVVLIAGLAYFILKMYNRRLYRKNALKFEEELTQAKLNYFTNISHELLTPLTLISCVADKLEQHNKETGKEVSTLRSNVSRLKRLLQQILDFRKVESGKMNLRISHGNLSSFIAGIAIYNFHPLAERKEITLTTDIEKDVWGYADFDKIDKILFNLLSNAIKYTPPHKRVTLSMQTCQKQNHPCLVLKVEDEGIGIATGDLSHVFTKFYNTGNHTHSESNGIGLSLTKEMVNLHHGTVEVTSELGKGSVFTVEIPIDKHSYTQEEIFTTPVQTEHREDPGTEYATSLLIADDNEELLELMADMLGRKYRVFTARNGEEALEIIKENPVDVLISDIMMPKMNGLELCRQIKSDLQTSHIPVIMLTAKNAPEDQIECYKAGAESYIGKPFDIKILQARIDNLVLNRESRQQDFRSKMEINISNLSYQAADEQFLNHAIQCVENHFEDSEFDIPALADELHISRSTLNRKIKAMTGLTPLDFIRNVKLKHACRLLQEKSVKISEVAYAMGFSSPKYFARCFKDEFGITPTEYQHKMNPKSIPEP